MKHTGFSWHGDWQLLLPIVLLTGMSLSTLFSLNTTFFKSQLLFIGLSVIVFFIFSHLHYPVLKELSLPIYVISIIVLVGVLLLGIESRGAIRWLDIFGIRIQLSEILKPFLLVCFASFLSTHPQAKLKNALMIIGATLPLCFIIYKQPDLGSALIYLFTVGLTLLFYGFPLWWFGVALGMVSALAPLLWQFLHDYQKQRVLTFLHLTNDPLGTSYNAIQALIAVGSGGIFGKGFGAATQSSLRFLPERHTDFIFSTISESLGFVGDIVLLGLFFYFFYRLFSLLMDNDDLFAKIYMLSALCLFFTQFFMNVGMNIGLVPIVGVTLPFVSYGGSSYLSNAILLGIIASMVKRAKRKHVLEIR